MNKFVNTILIILLGVASIWAVMTFFKVPGQTKIGNDEKQDDTSLHSNHQKIDKLIELIKGDNEALSYLKNKAEISKNIRAQSFEKINNKLIELEFKIDHVTTELSTVSLIIATEHYLKLASFNEKINDYIGNELDKTVKRKTTENNQCAQFFLIELQKFTVTNAIAMINATNNNEHVEILNKFKSKGYLSEDNIEKIKNSLP